MTLSRFKYFAAVLLAYISVAVPGSAEQPAKSQLLYGAIVFIASPAGSNMGAMLSNQIAKYKIPLTVSSERPYASYILAAFLRPAAGEAQPLPATARTRSGSVWQAKAVLADARTHAIAWTAELNGPCAACDVSPERAEQIMAARFVKKLKHDLFSKESISERVDDFLAP